jgi:arylsulfatase A-like enzyme
MISRMDEYVGQLLELLTELDLEENTLVMFTSDNGTTYNGGVDPEFFNSAGPLRGLKNSVYEGGIRVPMIAWWPGRIKPGSTTDHISANWDVLPTLADLTGATASGDIDGLSFLPTLLGRASRQKEHAYLYWENHGPCQGQQAVRMGNWKGVRLGVHADRPGPIELYDLSADIGEQRDVAAEHPELVRRIDLLMREAHTPSPVEGWNIDVGTGSNDRESQTAVLDYACKHPSLGSVPQGMQRHR